MDRANKSRETGVNAFFEVSSQPAEHQEARIGRTRWMQGNVISLASWRVTSPDGMPAPERRGAITRLRARVADGAIVYVVMHARGARNEWFVCDLYLIDGHRVTCITDDVARVLGFFDSGGDPGIRLSRPYGADPLRQLVDRSLSRVLFGERERLRHQVIG